MLFRKVGEQGTVKVDEAKDPLRSIRRAKREMMENKWKEKKGRGNMAGT